MKFDAEAEKRNELQRELNECYETTEKLKALILFNRHKHLDCTNDCSIIFSSTSSSDNLASVIRDR